VYGCDIYNVLSFLEKNYKKEYKQVKKIYEKVKEIK